MYTMFWVTHIACYEHVCVPSDMLLTQPTSPIAFNVSRINSTAGSFDITASPNSSIAISSSQDDITAYIFKVENESEVHYVLQV